MLMIPCPWCGPRDEHEYSYGGEAHITRPTDSMKMTDEEWSGYVFHRTNAKGVFLERWMHAGGCRRWFNAARDTVNNEVLGVYKMGEAPPKGVTPALQTRPKARGGRS
ncbi:MAG: sarcosine oxidase subunit delta [Rhodospirillales bacterium]